MNRKKLIQFFCLANLFSWIVFVLLAMNHHGYIILFEENATNARIADVLHSLGGLGPLLAILAIIRMQKNKSETLGFFSSYSLSKMNFTAWFLALTPLLLLTSGVIIARGISGKWYSLIDFIHNNNLYGTNLLLWLLPSIAYGFGEEAGWRGFALPELQKKYKPFMATSILAFFWIVWHVPSFFYRYNFSAGMLIGFVTGIYAGAILLTYVFNKTKGSLLTVSIWHLLWNVVSMMDKEGIISAVMSTIVIVIAIVILFTRQLKKSFTLPT